MDMNINEAFEVLGLPKTATLDEVKSKYRELAKKYHPDVNKAEDATDRFKKINSAFKTAQDFKEGRIVENNPFQFNDDGDSIFGGPFRRSRSAYHNIQPPQVKVKISFIESVTGCSRQVSFERLNKCGACDGEGFTLEKNGCTNCNGFGMSTTVNGNTIFRGTCMKCKGQNVKQRNCESCHHEGVIKTESNFSVNIPPGVKNGQVLRLGGGGHYVNTGFAEAYTDAFVILEVESYHDMIIEDNDVVSNINISLLEALIGCDKKALTAYGEVNVKIPALSKNREEIKFNNYGVKNTNGVHRFVLQVQYPDNIDNVIEVLKKGQES